MIALKRNGVSNAQIALLKVYAFLTHKMRKLSIGQKHFDAEPVFDKSSALSKPRYDYCFDWRLRDEHYRTYGGTYRWLIKSFALTKGVIRNADKIRAKVLLCIAGRDHLVDEAAQLAFAERVEDIRVLQYPNSKHEIFNATDAIRRDYYARIFDFYGGDE